MRLPALAIDTSGPYLQVGLFAGSPGATIVDVISIDLPKGHAEHLFGAIDDLLTRNQVKLADIKLLVTSIGPGSFTGLRIGLSAARALGLALDCPVIGLSNLVTLSLDVNDKLQEQPFDIIVDARREQVYQQTFSAPGIPASEPQITARMPEHDRVLVAPKLDLELMLRHAITLDPEAYPPNPLYLRPADARPQTKNLIARQTTDPISEPSA